jgi:DNA-directed RNA polymerase specialized sigma24 family protein
VVGAQEDGVSRRWRRYTEAERATMMRMWDEGWSLDEIARAVDRTESGVHAYISLHRRDYPYRKIWTTEEERDQMVTLREQGMSYVEIGKYLGINSETVRRHCQERSA